jgi:hypothetical protein
VEAAHLHGKEATRLQAGSDDLEVCEQMLMAYGFDHFAADDGIERRWPKSLRHRPIVTED